MKHTFGEQKTEFKDGQEYRVSLTPKYVEARDKVISLLDSEEYKNILSDSDFWILKSFKGDKCFYSTLIINHNACLKLNDHLPKEQRFDPAKCQFVSDVYSKGLLMEYRDDELLEYGEVNQGNCKSPYPYAMVLKRLFDRVVLKKTKIAYSGIMSDSESEEFKEPVAEKRKKKEICINSNQWGELRKLYELDEIKSMYLELGITKGSEIPLEYFNKKILERTHENEIDKQAEFA